ncbi:XRE family transcriptional regulator [Catellatospora methionotrophica]|uniref:XRE family transcriptional regulator n=1 Tax=Catellatospora methionotrophica TaxID=121620 RepID=UPI0033D4F316
MDEGSADVDNRPGWARRLRAERLGRGWSQADAVRALRAHADRPLPEPSSLMRNWKRWEAGGTEPDSFHKALIAQTFGTVTGAFFPRQHRSDDNTGVLGTAGMDTHELLARLRASDVSPATLEAVRLTADRLCCAYQYMPSAQLLAESRAWLQRITGLLDRRLTLSQHQEVLTLAGWVALLTGCVEYDIGQRGRAEATRRAALSLGQESGNADIIGWAYEMRAWYALTQGDLRGAITAAECGENAASGRGVAVQLAAQRAKASARLGDRRQVERALEQGRSLLESRPHPDNLDNHFVVDPAKFDYYAMDGYRVVGDDRRAGLYADEVIRASSGADGAARHPMRLAEARLTLGVLAARGGDLDSAVAHGLDALGGDRRSLPSLLLVSQELTGLIQGRYAGAAQATTFLAAVDGARAEVAVNARG